MTRKATYADVVAAPARYIAELIAGDLMLTPRPATPHAVASSRLGAILGGPFDLDPDGGWILLDEPELHFGSDVVIPDLAGWRRARFPADAAEVAFITVPPDWVCEVVSPSTARWDRTRKSVVYAQVGVASWWVIDPVAQTLEVFRNEGGRWLLIAVHSGGDPVCVEPFERLAWTLSALWLTSQGGGQ